MSRALLLLLVLAACEAPQQRFDAAEDVRAFLQAARTGDRATFDRHVDREALKAQLSAVVGRLLAEQNVPPAARAPLLDRLVDSFGPEMFQMATQGAGPLAGRAPSAPEIAAVLRPLGEQRVCLPTQPAAADCAATFENQGGTWRLVAVDVSGVRLGPARPPQFEEEFRGE